MLEATNWQNSASNSNLLKCFIDFLKTVSREIICLRGQNKRQKDRDDKTKFDKKKKTKKNELL